jgi:hypothetical protein
MDTTTDQDAYAAGYQQGYDKGYDEGYQAGLTAAEDKDLQRKIVTGKESKEATAEREWQDSEDDNRGQSDN